MRAARPLVNSAAATPQLDIWIHHPQIQRLLTESHFLLRRQPLLLRRLDSVGDFVGRRSKRLGDVLIYFRDGSCSGRFTIAARKSRGADVLRDSLPLARRPHDAQFVAAGRTRDQTPEPRLLRERSLSRHVGLVAGLHTLPDLGRHQRLVRPDLNRAVWAAGLAEVDTIAQQTGDRALGHIATEAIPEQIAHLLVRRTCCPRLERRRHRFGSLRVADKARVTDQLALSVVRRLSLIRALVSKWRPGGDVLALIHGTPRRLAPPLAHTFEVPVGQPRQHPEHDRPHRRGRVVAILNGYKPRARILQALHGNDRLGQVSTEAIQSKDDHARGCAVFGTLDQLLETPLRNRPCAGNVLFLDDLADVDSMLFSPRLNGVELDRWRAVFLPARLPTRDTRRYASMTCAGTSEFYQDPFVLDLELR